MNDSRSRPRIKLVVDWIKGVKMDVPHSRWVMFAIGVYILAAAADKLASTLITVIHALP